MTAGKGMLRWGSGLMLLALLLTTAACQRSAPPSASEQSAPGQFGPARFPMPRAEFYERISAPLLATCRNSQKEYRLAREACITLVTQRLQTCLPAARAPATIDSLEQFKALGRPVLECAKPYPFCNGVEVRDMQQALQHCSPDELKMPSR